MKSHPAYLPTSYFPLPTSRPALTLVEVLIAMGVLAVGLLGVAAVFPVGGHYLQTGDVADRAGAVAQAALEDAVVQGYLDPENWVVHDIQANPGAFMNLHTGASPTPTLPARIRPISLQASLNEALLPSTVAGQARTKPAARAALLGGAYVIDPLGLSMAMSEPGPTPPAGVSNTTVTNQLNSAALRRFPAFANGSIVYANAWNHWQANNLYWPVRRVTVFGSIADMNSTNNLWQFARTQTIARDAFTAKDDLALTLPTSGDTPARQQWRRVSTGAPSSRQSARDFSWIISVSPDTDRDRSSWSSRRDAYPVEVSAVVFNKRALGVGIEAALQSERLVNARVVTSGPAGGEVVLDRRPVGTATKYLNEPSTSPFEGLRAGEYVMVVAPHPLSSDANPRLALRWCRVVAIEDQGTVEASANGQTLALSRDQRVLVSLRGPDWPWQPAANLTDNTQLSNDLRVAILPGAVAVHTKTMRLEAGSEWSVE